MCTHRVKTNLLTGVVINISHRNNSFQLIKLQRFNYRDK